MQKLSIIIPAYNEETRIGNTLKEYVVFFSNKKRDGLLDFELIVVLNGCKDGTYDIAKAAQAKHQEIRLIDLKEAGKGLAVAVGFKDALTRKNDLIGFVDADMATKPEHFYELSQKIGKADGIIASRYMKESKIFPPRPFIKEWGRLLVYNPMTYLLFFMSYKDFQCGAKLFKRDLIEKVCSHLRLKQWAFDIELLYLCKKHGFLIKEIPTVWYDQGDSKFTIKAGMRMLGTLVKLRLIHSPLNWLIKKK